MIFGRGPSRWPAPCPSRCGSGRSRTFRIRGSAWARRWWAKPPHICRRRSRFELAGVMCSSSTCVCVFVCCSRVALKTSRNSGAPNTMSHSRNMTCARSNILPECGTIFWWIRPISWVLFKASRTPTPGAQGKDVAMTLDADDTVIPHLYPPTN